MERKVWLSITAAVIGAALIIAASATAAPSKSSAQPTKAAQAAATGGTLVTELNSDVDYTDPQLTYYSPMWELMYATACKLMNYPDKEAPVGGTLQPEVAAGLPVVSKDGKTYTFTIKSGFRFSNGQNVTAQSFADAINRLDNPKLASSTSFLTSDIIVGAQDRLNGKTSSVTGVSAKGNKLTIKLTHAAPDLLARLATPPFQAIPPSLAANADPAGVNASPSCGPYYIAARTPGRSITIKKNPYYKGSRPHNVAGIQVNIGNSTDVIYQDVVKGTTDYAEDGVTPTLYAGIAQKYGINKKQFFTRPELEVDYLALNHDPGRLFHNNSALAQALNYAVDRHAYLAQRGFLAGARTNRILPPGMAGVTKATEVLPNGYPINASAASVAKAKKLAAGHTGSGSAEMWAPNSGPGPLQAQIVQFDLAQIGVKVNIKLLPRAQQFVTARNRSEATYDINWSAWGADYNDPFDFINILLDGTSIGPTSNNNDAYYNSAKFNAAMQKASLITVGPARDAAYNQLDQAMMSQDPPWAPMFNRTNRLFVSSHYGCFVYNPVFEVDLAAACKT
ncbi:MAG TPA: ABC transporter substrate-binding protein [Gaiellaceae bacterium]|nr:ABC transporter substrate-binding protein [Gaiellaceae bacterium]